MELIKEIGAFAGLVAFLGLALLALLSFSQGRDIRRLREWAGSAPERDAERKETTSEAAAERAEEMRRAEEAREAERRAEELREERRRRREAGLPELSRGERLRERLDGIGFDRRRLGEPRYLVAIFAAFVLLAAGGAYAAMEGFGGDDGGKGGKARKAAAPKPGDVEVTVLNGTAVPGLAATYGDMLERKGFQLGDVTNSESSFADSVVMFEPNSGREAHLVAKALQIDRVRAMTSDIVAVSGGAPVSVVVGEDNASTAG
ncbi:MAG TPA: LytR C-terminal domain-containing protein [Solirubrobacterales bacterium]|nr:LytR C-terminal domain-containing protein [Solirubrobacterales bacterium]